MTRNPNMASEIGAPSHIFRDIDVLVLSSRRPSLAAPPRGPQVCRTFIGTIPHHHHIFLRNLVLTFFRCHRLKYWLPTSAGPLCGLVAVPFVLLLVRSSQCCHCTSTKGICTSLNCTSNAFCTSTYFGELQ